MIAACTDTSSAEVTSSQTSSPGRDQSAGRSRPAGARRRTAGRGSGWRSSARSATDASAAERPGGRAPAPKLGRSARAAASMSLRRRSPRVQRGVRVLEHVLDRAQRVARAGSRSRAARAAPRSATSPVQLVCRPDDAARERGLARARLADDRDARVRPATVEVDVVQHRPARRSSRRSPVTVSSGLAAARPPRIRRGPRCGRDAHAPAARSATSTQRARWPRAAPSDQRRQRGPALGRSRSAQRGANEQPAGRCPGRGGMPVHTAPGAAGRSGDGTARSRPRGVGVRRCAEHLRRRAGLDQPAGVQHRDPVGDLADHARSWLT